MSALGEPEIVVVDPLEDYIRDNEINVDDAEQFRNELFNHAIDTIDNRIVTQAGKIPNELLYQYSANLFLGGDDETSKQKQANRSEKCVLEVHILRAEGLAPKDVNGTSDPYCSLGLASDENFSNFNLKKHSTKYVTSVQSQNLNPEWNECIQIPVHRDRIEETFFHIQVWDHDDAESVSTTIGALKDVKGVRAMGRYMKEVAQTMSKKDDHDDFMGFSALPLTNIPLEGIEKWYHLRSHSALQGISGRIKIRLKLFCPRVLIADRGHPGKTKEMLNVNRVESQYPDDVIYGGILLLVVNGRHNVYKELMGEDEDGSPDGWDGELQKVDDALLNEFVLQRRISQQTCAIARWEIYAQEHMQMKDGIQMNCMSSLLKTLEKYNDEKEFKNEMRPIRPISGNGEKPLVFVFDKLSRSFDKFLRHCHTKIVYHRTVYPLKKNDTILRLGDLLICMKTLREMKVYLTARLIDTTMFGSGDVSKDITASLRESMIQFYSELCAELRVINANVANLDEGNPIEEYNVPGLVKLVDEIHNFLVNVEGYYQPVFKKVLNIDYVAAVLGVLSTRLSEDLEGILHKVNKAISLVPDPIEVESADKSASMFQLYLSLRDFTEYMNKLTEGYNTNDASGKLSINDMTDGKEEVSTHIDSLKGYHNWFRPTILRWLQMSRGRTVQRLTAAVQLDKVERVDDIVKHSSSAVDAIACLNSVVTFWLQIRWPDPLDGFLIATRMTEDISSGVELYADLVHNKLKAVGFFDDEGQFDVTEELCLALNNLEKVKLFLDEVLRDMEIDTLAAKIDMMEEGPTGEKLMQSFHVLVRNADSGMRMKIQEVASVVGKKMQTDVLKYLKEYAAKVLKVQTKSTGNGPLNGHDSDYNLNEAEWHRNASDAVGPLMNYLTTNVITLKNWLCDPNFQRVLDVLWRVCLQSFRHVVFSENKNQKPYFFKQCRYILTEHLTSFFHAEGEGLSEEIMFAVEEYVAVDAQLRMKSASTRDLMRLFFSQLFDEQNEMKANPIYGALNVHSYYDSATSEVKVDVISAENLLPQDMNGLSDPFVQLTLMPKPMFPNQRTYTTLEKKKTLNPFYENESYSFEVDRELLMKEGAVLAFTVLDYDFIGKNDLEGECYLMLNTLDGIKDNPHGRGNRNYKLPLMQPGNEKSGSNNSSPTRRDDDVKKLEARSQLSATTLALIRERGRYDRDASEFSRWRKKLTDAAKDDDSSSSGNIFKNIIRD